MKEMMPATTPQDTDTFIDRPMLESLEPRRLLSGASPETVVTFGFAAVTAPASYSSMSAGASGFHGIVVAPLAAHRTFEGFGAPLGERIIGIVYFVTPWSAPAWGDTTIHQTDDTGTSPTRDVKSATSVSTPVTNDSPSNDSPSGDAALYVRPIAAVTQATEPVRPVDASHMQAQATDDPNVFASAIIQSTDNTAAHGNITAEPTGASHAVEFSALSRDILASQRQYDASHSTASRPWYQLIDRDILHQQNNESEASPASKREPIAPMHEGRQAESLRKLALRAARETNIIHEMQPMAANVESTPISVWQRVGMVTLTAGALVTNWYVRRRRAKLAMNGFPKEAGKNPFLP